MKDKVRLLSESIKAVWIKDEQGLKSLLIKYGVSSVNDSDFESKTTRLISENEDFANNYIELLKKNSFSNAFGDNAGGGNAGDIISAALKGIGMVTSTWRDTAKIKADAQIGVAQIGVSKKLSQGQIMLIVFGGIIVTGLTVFLIIKSTNK